MQCCTRLYDLYLLQLTAVKSTHSKACDSWAAQTVLQGSTVLMSACGSGHLPTVILLLSRGADITAQNNQVRQHPQCMLFDCASFV